MVRKILIYGDLDLNIIDGSSIWLVNLAKLLLEDKENYVDILLKKRIRNHILVGEIEKRYRIRLLYVKDYIDHITEVDSGNIVKVLKTIDELRDYSCMIIRGTQVMESVAGSGIIGKVIPYLTDFCHDKDKMPDTQKSFLKDLYRKVQAYFVQTEAMKQYLKDVLNVDGSKFHVLYPVVFPGKKQEKQPKTIVYAGKIAKDWNILELLDIMDRLRTEDPAVRLHFIGSKVNRDLAEQKQEIFGRLKSADNIIFHGAQPHSETERITKGCCLGYSFRSRAVDHDNSLEVSVKLLEYCHGGVPVVLRRTKMHMAILGEDYPLFVESEEECLEKILTAFRDREVWEKAEACLSRSAEKFSVKHIYENVRKALQVYPEKDMRLLVSGHDLKFLKPLFPYFKSEFALEVQELDEYMEFSAKEAAEYLKRADIIWCEWLLTSAQWYSNHAYPHQHLFIRAHRFEVARKYGNNIDINRVSKVITVSYYWFEEFTRRFRIPAEKCTIVDNFIDTKRYVKEKTPDSRFHLALIGALPKRKGLDRAVELLRMLKEKDPRYCLHVPGKRPEEFPNTWNVPEEREYPAIMLSDKPFIRAFVVVGPPVFHSVLLMEAFNLSVPDHRKAGKRRQQRAYREVLVTVAELGDGRLLIGVVHEVHVALEDLRLEDKRVLYSQPVLLVLLILEHVHERGVVDPVHSECSHEVAFHHPESLCEKQCVRNFLSDPVNDLSPEFLRDSPVELLVGHGVSRSSCDISAAARFGVPESLDMSLR